MGVAKQNSINKLYFNFITEFIDRISQLFTQHNNHIQKHQFNSLRPLIKELIESLFKKSTFQKLKLNVDHTIDYGTNLILKNRISAYQFPLLLLKSANWRKALENCQNYFRNLDPNTPWKEIQYQIYEEIISVPLRSLGHSGHFLEGVRLLLTWFHIDPFSFSFEQTITETEPLQKFYYPKYTQAKSASIYQSIQNYFQKSSRKSFIPSFGFTPVPNFYYWNLDILILDPDQLRQLPNDKTIAHCPIGFVYDTSGSVVFGIYWISGNSIPHQNPLHKNLVKRAHLFLNFNHFKLDPKKGLKKAKNPNRLIYFPHLVAIQNLLQYWGKSPPPVLDHFTSPALFKENSLYTPNWDLILDTSTYYKGPMDQGLLDYREKSLIRFYNVRLQHLGDWNNFFEPQFNTLYHLFPFRVVSLSIGYTTSYHRIILFLEPNHKKRIPKILFILKLWLIDAIVFETFNSILVITRIPIEFINEKFETELKTFFKQLEIKYTIFYEKRPNSNVPNIQQVQFTPLSYYKLPGSEFFSEEKGIWQLPSQAIKMTNADNQQYLDNLFQKENQNLKKGHKLSGV